jgi:Holliday junction resolvase RusA-like endonuclease
MDANTLSKQQAIAASSSVVASDTRLLLNSDVSTTSRHRIQFTIHGKVVGKGRPHFIRKTGMAITPTSTRSYESLVRDYAMKEMGGCDPWTFPVRALLVAHYEIPKSWSKQKREEASRQLIAPSKPDVDNVVKVVLDACNRTVYVDDTQVVQCVVVKRFGESAKLEVVFEESSEEEFVYLGKTGIMVGKA